MSSDVRNPGETSDRPRLSPRAYPMHWRLPILPSATRIYSKSRPPVEVLDIRPAATARFWAKLITIAPPSTGGSFGTRYMSEACIAREAILGSHKARSFGNFPFRHFGSTVRASGHRVPRWGSWHDGRPDARSRGANSWLTPSSHRSTIAENIVNLWYAAFPGCRARPHRGLVAFRTIR